MISDMKNMTPHPHKHLNRLTISTLLTAFIFSAPFAQAAEIKTLKPNQSETRGSTTTQASPPLEPKLPPGLHPGGVNVAIYDTGVNYTLPQLVKNLARDGEGELIGYDFQDDDLIAYDRRPTSNGLPPRGGATHGTSVASILLQEGPKDIAIQPYRYRADDLRSFAGMVSHTAITKTSIVAISLGGYKKSDWDLFRQAATHHPEILFIISAGNDGRNIDEKPVYPASFDIPNTIVVTSTDNFGRYPENSNWGVNGVDISTPAENLTGFDVNGQPKRLSGSSFAVPRIAALAARIKTAEPEIKTDELKARILSFAAPSPGTRTKRTKHGWIANPAQLAK